MILFCDTSALVKLYVEEDDTGVVVDRATRADVVAVCRIAWAEAMAAMARRAREQPRSGMALDIARQRLASDWPRYAVVDVTQELVERAGEYADAFALRAYDAVQLAAVKTLEKELPGQVQFACFDGRLVKASRMLGVETIDH